MDHVGPDEPEMVDDCANGRTIVGLVDDGDIDPVALHLAHGAAGRQGDDRALVMRRVEPGHQAEHVLLGAAVGARGEDLNDADPFRAGHRNVLDRGEARIPDRRPVRIAGVAGLAGRRRRVARAGTGGHQARASSQRTRRRWIGSSTEPHSYL